MVSAKVPQNHGKNCGGAPLPALPAAWSGDGQRRAELADRLVALRLARLGPELAGRFILRRLGAVLRGRGLLLAKAFAASWMIACCSCASATGWITAYQ
jgi:hypothetical protein